MVMTNGPPAATTNAATIQPESATFFDSQSNSRQVGSASFFSGGESWQSIRDQGVAPYRRGPLADDGQHRAELIEGGRLLGFTADDLKPQQLLIADALAAPGLDTFVIEAMRRSSKSTSIFQGIIGRCQLRPGTKVAFSAQSGVMGGRMFRDWAGMIDRAVPPDPFEAEFAKRRQKQTAAARHAALFGDDLQEQREDTSRGFRILRAAGQMGIEWDNGSTFKVLKPDAENFRSMAADIVWLDEAQELEIEQGEDLLAGILPLMDTRPDSALIISGTAGDAQAGEFWKHLALLRKGDPEVGGADWAADPNTPWADLQSEEIAMQLLASVHPGVGTLTTLDKMRKNYRKLSRPKWAREYLSLWPETSADVAIPSELWTAGLLKSRPRKPTKFALGLSISPGGTYAALAAAWRTSTGHAHVEILDHRLGTKWIADEVPDLVWRLKTSLGVDMTPEAQATVTEMDRGKRRPRIAPMNWSAMNAGCVQIMRDLERQSLRHQGQTMLDEAVENATRREVRGQTQAWLWGSVPGKDVSPLVAATVALRNWDTNHARRTSGGTIITADAA